jgi:hypothetical protein
MARKTVSIVRKPSAQAANLTTGPSQSEQLMFVLEHEPRRAPPEPPVAGFIGRAVYGTLYCLSYGVVFGAMVVGSIIPGSGLIGRALRDGAAAAQGGFHGKPGHVETASMSFAAP